MTHVNVGRLRAFLDHHAAGDREALGRLLAEDAVWHVGGRHRFSGDLHGREAILAYFDAVRKETDGTLDLQPLELLANDRRGAAFLRVTAQRQGRDLDVVMAEAFVFAADGTIQEFWAHAADQDSIDRFWE